MFDLIEFCRLHAFGDGIISLLKTIIIVMLVIILKRMEASLRLRGRDYEGLESAPFQT